MQPRPWMCGTSISVEAENGKGWYRRIVLDWGVGADLPKTMPASKNKVGEE